MRRSVGLTIMLILYTLGGIAVGVVLVREWISLVEHGAEVPVLLVLTMAGVLAQLVGVTALWFWRIWGLHLVGVLAAIGLVLDIASGRPALLIASKVVFAGALVFTVIPYWDRMHS